MILPSRYSLYALIAIIPIAGLVVAFPSLSLIWLGALALLFVALTLDALLCIRKPNLEIQRDMPQRFALGVKQTIGIQLQNQGKRRVTLQWHDHVPESMQVQQQPQRLSLAAEEHANSHYTLTAKQRGRFNFPQIQVRALSPLKLWWRAYLIPLPQSVKVYPNYTSISQYTSLATDHHLNQIGVVKKQRRGEGSDFHQLREYREGDSLRQIDWKATARMQKPISREYQDERNQEVMIMLDCGHRMLAKDDELSHFDHILNSILLLSHVALKQGDGVGVGTFAGEPRWLPAQKGQIALQSILNQVYDLNPTPYAPDYRQAATEFLVRQKRRSLVIVVSNLRDEDLDDLLPAMQSLRKRHLVLLVSMREQVLDHAAQNKVYNFDQALEHAALTRYLASREHLLKRLQAMGVQALDVPPQALTATLINNYLTIKRSGAL